MEFFLNVFTEFNESSASFRENPFDYRSLEIIQDQKWKEAWNKLWKVSQT